MEGVGSSLVSEVCGELNIKGITLQNVLYVPIAHENIISQNKLVSIGYFVTTYVDKQKELHARINKDGKIITECEREGMLFYLYPEQLQKDLCFQLSDNLILQIHTVLKSLY